MIALITAAADLAAYLTNGPSLDLGLLMSQLDGVVRAAALPIQRKVPQRAQVRRSVTVDNVDFPAPWHRVASVGVVSVILGPIKRLSSLSSQFRSQTFI